MSFFDASNFVVHDSVAFQIGSFAVKWYGIIIACATLLAILICMKRADKVGLTSDNIVDLCLILIPSALVGARLYYVAFEWDMFKDNLISILNIRTGGMAIYGGVIGGVIGVFAYAKYKKLNPFRMLDLIGPSLILAQGIGRWANFCNQEAFGVEFVNEAMHWFPLSVYIERFDGYFAATFFYESVWCILMFFVLSKYLKKLPKPGNVFALYLMLYGVERVFVEGLRTDSLYIGPIRVSQLLSLILVLVMGIYLAWQYFKAKKSPEADIEADESLKIIAEKEKTETDEPDEPDEPQTAEENEKAEEAKEGSDENA